MHRFKSRFNNCKTMHRKKKDIKLNELQKLSPINIREKNLISRQQQYNCFNKNEIRIMFKSFLTLAARKILFLSLGLENRNLLWYHDFLGRWEKLYCEK